MDNMYKWITRTRNFIGGECPHQCRYCYVTTFKKMFPALKNKYSGGLRLIEKELKMSEGRGQTVFVQDCGDLFAQEVPSEMIEKVLSHCCDYPLNRYLFQTKNPKRFLDFINKFPKNTILGTTIESDRNYPDLSRAPSQKKRAIAMGNLEGFEKMVSIEPILDFHLDSFMEMIQKIDPKFISIGADSKSHGLKEPDPSKINELINELKGLTEVRIKENLKRLLKGI